MSVNVQQTDETQADSEQEADSDNERENKTSAFSAIRNGNLQKLQEILKKGKYINMTDKNNKNNTLLQYAVEKNRKEIVEELLQESKCEINAKNDRGDTPLHIAVSKGFDDLVQLLLITNAEVNLENYKGVTPLDIAKQNLCNEEITDILKGQPHPIKPTDFIKSILKKRKALASLNLHEIYLTMWLLLEVVTDNNISNFYLASNMLEASAFNDLVLKYDDETGNSKTIFLQVKNEAGPNNLNIDDISTLEDLSVKKYFTSYRKIKQQFFSKKGPIFSSDFEDTEFIVYAVVFCINVPGNFKEIKTDQKDILQLPGSTGKFYKLQLNENEKEKIMHILQKSSESTMLAQYLVQEIYTEKGIDMEKDIFRNYQIPLLRYVIEKINDESEYKVKDSFLNNDASLSPVAKKFRSVFFEEAEKMFEKSEPVLQEELHAKIIKIPKKFDIKNENGNLELPNDDPISDQEINDFLKKFKILASQPKVEDLKKSIKDKIEEVFAVNHDDIDSVFSEVEYKVTKWWKSGNYYLQKDNSIFMDAARMSVEFEVVAPALLFTGRTMELENLHKILQKDNVACVTGFGGIGKRELVRKYISNYRRDYDGNIVWINGTSYTTIAESFRRLAKEKLKIYTLDKKEKDTKLVVKDVYDFFAKRNRKSLFVMENVGKHRSVDDTQDIDAFLPSGDNKTHLLITSRDPDWSGIKTLSLEVFTFEEANKYINKALNIASEENLLGRLANELRSVPLALKQAVACLKVETQGSNTQNIDNIKVNRYLERFNKKANELLNFGKGEPYDPCTTTVMTTCQVAIDKIKQTNAWGCESAIEIIEIVAYLSPEKIPFDEIFSRMINNKEERHSAVELLHQYSLANFDRGKLNTDRLVQQVIRINIREEKKEEKLVEKALGLFKVSINLMTLDHAISVWNHAVKYSKLVQKFSQVSCKIVDKLYDAQRRFEAHLFGMRTLKLFENVLSLGYSNILINSMIYIAGLLHAQGEYNDALKAYKTVLNKQSETLGPSSYSALSTKINIGKELSSQGKYDDALQVYQEVLGIQKENFKLDHSAILSTQQLIAEMSLLQKQIKFKESWDVEE